MSYTIAQLATLKKPEILEIAKNLEIKGRARMTREQLTEAILAASPEASPEASPDASTEASLEASPEVAPEVALVASPEVSPEVSPEASPEALIEFIEIPSPSDFFNFTKVLNTKLEVNRACNVLLDLLTAKHTPATISKNLTPYKKLFYDFQHENPELNETVSIKGETKTQHIAGQLLTLSDEQNTKLKQDRQSRDDARAGINADGDVRDVDKPPIDIEAIIKKSLKCLNSSDPHTIGAGIINLTGLRANEQNAPIMKYEKYDLVQRDMVLVDEFTIAFKGLSKKRTEKETNTYYTRATLVPAQMIIDAQKRFLDCKIVQAITGDYEQYRSGFLSTFGKRYKSLFGDALATIEAYDDNGNKIAANGSPHKGRAFYACALRSILKDAKNFNNKAATRYIQLCLAHENTAETEKYLGRYDENDFINPIDIAIPTNLHELEKMTTITPIKTPQAAKVSPVKIPQAAKVSSVPNAVNTPKVAPKDTFDIDTFITGLDGDLQVKFAELLNSESSITNAVLTLINTAKSQKPTGVKKVSVSEEVATIVDAIMSYNAEQKELIKRVVPTYKIINEISKRFFNKEMALKTVDTWLTDNPQIQEKLTAFGIPRNTDSKAERTLWNGKHHRKTMDAVIDTILTVLNRG